MRQCELHVLDVQSAFYPHALVVGLYAKNLVGLCVEAFGMIEVFRAEEQRQIVALLHVSGVCEEEVGVGLQMNRAAVLQEAAVALHEVGRGETLARSSSADR